jgi:hyperosmotically inducible periplasmic protein
MLRTLLLQMITACVIPIPLAAQSAAPAQQRSLSQVGIERINREVRHELLLLPYYGVFDNLGYRVAPDGSVTLVGQVTRPTLKSDAESSVKHIEGVERVDNQIQVLRVSPMDDQIRRATYRAIYGNSTLAPYGVRAVPPIHIIVGGGHVTLEGAVATKMDKQIAETQAKSVPIVFLSDGTCKLTMRNRKGNMATPTCSPERRE